MQQTNANKQKTMRTIAQLQQSETAPGSELTIKNIDMVDIYQLQERVYYLSQYVENMQSALYDMKTYHDLDEVKGGDDILGLIEQAEAQLNELMKPLFGVGQLLQNLAAEEASK